MKIELARIFLISPINPLKANHSLGNSIDEILGTLLFISISPFIEGSTTMVNSHATVL